MASKMDDGIVLSGYQKKLKTMKKKYFVLYKETSNNAARLEYYDNEKKFHQRLEAKRVIYLKNCFNINRRFDTKHKFVLALSSREGGFGIVLDTESDLQKWLDSLLSLQRYNANFPDQVFPQFEHVWQVVVQRKGISEKVGIVGSYHCCLTSKSITFISIGPEKSPTGDDRVLKAEILLTTVRRCGHASPQCIFYMELGRQCVLGSGELWMETEDATVAKNMHDTILSAMSAKTNVCQEKSVFNNENMRKRSSSVNEGAKPVTGLQKRQLSTEIHNLSSKYTNCVRERCDSLPSRNRTSSECTNQSYKVIPNHTQRSNTISGTRPFSGQGRSHSPPLNTPIRCSEGKESSNSIEEADDNGCFNPYRLNTRAAKGIIPEENVDDFCVIDNICGRLDTYIPMTPIKSPNEFDNVNHISQLNQNLLNQESSKMSSLGDTNRSFDFADHAFKKIERDSDVDHDIQCDRPVRAYSIGSRMEHFKANVRRGNTHEIESNLPRERAFSVGARSKNNTSGTNSYTSIDHPTYNRLVGFSTSRDKKSTSAPLLNLKSQINADRMSDLMEIDFSKTSTESSLKKYPVHNKKTSSLKVASQFGAVIKCDDMMKRCNSGNITETSDSGYLEMKPVGNPSKVEPLPNKSLALPAKIVSTKKDHPSLSPVHGADSCKVDKTKLQLNDYINDKDANLLTTTGEISVVNSNLENKMQNLFLDIRTSNITKPVNYSRKLTHSISNEDYSQNLKASIAELLPETGYKILQIKSDSSLISTKPIPRTIINKLEKQHKTKMLECANTSKRAYINETPTKRSASVTAKEIQWASNTNANANNNKPLNEQNSSSRPASLTSDHELHYASLDLPQCSGQITAKNCKEAAYESPPETISSSNLYARIDFDHSDSSSSLSNVFKS
ncbi:insulin receptor substrate 1 [Scaptodrosophila lebanonensis]|uniref:Insulin receptor substrate 1 n=1 Tax=Drosophila lebanonensis TaxID=7225 RepID=A0A6J2U413_DROLE|nr:insulin receptor substrate 1 [Scaptodrosophila lebanonensis]XP_030383371.1 insulin receptor substrate 1 [Scaptodrosophila lebanonensis]